MNNDSILHLIAVSFAIGLAYIALDRFRYYGRSKDRLSRAIVEVRERIKEKNPACLDTAITRLEKKLKDITNNGLGPKFIFNRSPRAFGGGNKSGWDIYIIYFLLFLQYISLLFSCMFSNVWFWLSYIMFIIAAFGTGIPVVFIILGNRQSHIIEAFISRVFQDVSDVYEVSIKEMRDNLDKT